MRGAFLAVGGSGRPGLDSTSWGVILAQTPPLVQYLLPAPATMIAEHTTVKTRTRRLRGVLVVGALGALAAAVQPAAAEPIIDMYTGNSFTLNSDVRIRQPTQGDKFTFDDISFESESFTTPPYYGLRFGYYFE